MLSLASFISPFVPRSYRTYTPLPTTRTSSPSSPSPSLPLPHDATPPSITITLPGTPVTSNPPSATSAPFSFFPLQYRKRRSQIVRATFFLFILSSLSLALLAAHGDIDVTSASVRVSSALDASRQRIALWTGPTLGSIFVGESETATIQSAVGDDGLNWIGDVVGDTEVGGPGPAGWLMLWVNKAKALGLRLGWVLESEQEEEDQEKLCRGWEPQAADEFDPSGCVKARQYRQVQKAIFLEASEDENIRLSWYFTHDHVLASLNEMLPCFLPSSHPESKVCPPRPAIITSYWWLALWWEGVTSGETIWMGSVIKQATGLGYWILPVHGYEGFIRAAELMPDVYHSAWVHDVQSVSCITDPRCVAKEHYVPPIEGEDLSIGVPDEERGVIPAYRIISADYWGSRPTEISEVSYWWKHDVRGDWSYHPLGQGWIITPWDLPGGHVHLPYSIEEYCLAGNSVPPEERGNDILILAKKSSYFYTSNMAPSEFWPKLAADVPYRILTACVVEDGYPVPDGIVHIGSQTREEYEKLVGSVKALVGVGRPSQSPSVYSALCQATPVVVQYYREDISYDGWEKFSNKMQHGPAQSIGPPYVHSYYAYNYTQLLDAVLAAASSRIERFIPANMRQEYAIKQLAAFLERDNEALFNAVSERNGGIPRLAQGARERCFELERCEDLLPAGVVKQPVEEMWRSRGRR